MRDIHKIERNNYICIGVFGYENKKKYAIYVSRNTFKRHVYSLLIGEEDKRHYVLIRDFSTSMYDHTLHHRRRHFYCCCLKAFTT